MKPEDVSRIKLQTDLSLPDDDLYLYRLGVAMYGFASITTTVIETTVRLELDTGHLKHDGENARWRELQSKVGGKILNAFRESVEMAKSSSNAVYEAGMDAVSNFQQLNIERSDFAHAYAITSNTRGQILHRRVDGDEKYFEVTNEFLDNYISRLNKVSNKLYEIRDLVNAGELTACS